MTDAEARESVRQLVTGVTRRLRLRRLLGAAPVALAAGLLGVLAARWAPGDAATALRGAALLLPLAWLGWRTWRPLPPLEAAAWADRRAGLADALLTACWFLERGRGDDAWLLHQRRRAAEAARELAPAGLVELRVPPLPAALAALAALVVILTAGSEGPRAGRAAAAAAVDPERPGPQPPTGDGEARPPEAEAGLDGVSSGLPAPADLQAIAEALRAGLTEEPAERLRELAREASAQRPPEADAASTGEAAAENASGEALSGDELAAALAEAAEAAQRGDAEAASRALEAAQAAEARRQPPPAEAAGQPRQAGPQDEAAAQAPAEAGVRWSLDALDPQSLGAEEAQQAARGDAAGPPSGGEPEEGEATELDVELQREALSSESARETEPSEITEEASREQASRVAYRGGEGAGRYDAARPLEAAAVPWSARERVRRYLLALTAEEPQR